MLQVTAVALKTAAVTTAAVAAVVAPVVRKQKVDVLQGQVAARANLIKMPKIAMRKVKRKWR